MSSDATEPYVWVIGPPRLDGGGQASALWRRAFARREAREAAAVVVLGDLSQNGAASQLAGLGDPARRGAIVVPGPADVPRNGRAAALVDDAVGVPPRVVTVAPGCQVVALDSVRVRGGRDALGPGQLATLEELLAGRAEGTRTVVVLAHDPRSGGGKRPSGAALSDRKALVEILKRYGVALVVHGQTEGWVRGTVAGAPSVAPPPLAGCRLTGMRVALQVRFPAGEAGCAIERVHHSPPAGQPALAEAFAAADLAGGWAALAEKIVAADDTFEAVAQEMRAREVRHAALVETSVQLDGQLAALLRRAGMSDDE